MMKTISKDCTLAYAIGHFECCKQKYNRDNIFLKQQVLLFYALVEKKFSEILNKNQIDKLCEKFSIITKKNKTYTYWNKLRNFLQELTSKKNQFKTIQLLSEWSFKNYNKKNISINWSTFYNDYILFPRNLLFHEFELSAHINTEEKIKFLIDQTNTFYDYLTKLKKEFDNLKGEKSE